MDSNGAVHEMAGRPEHRRNVMELIFDLIAGAVYTVRQHWIAILFAIAFASGALFLISSMISMATRLYAV